MTTVRPDTTDGSKQSLDQNKRRIVFVTGMSGAGKSTALKAFEDLGFEAVDNLPLSLLSDLVFSGDSDDSVAIGFDVRTRNFKAERLLESVERLRTNDELDVTLLYLECSSSELENRFKITRRPHPLAHDRRVIDGINQERELTRPLKHEASMVVDTSSRTPADFRHLMKENFAPSSTSRLTLFVTSFSFAHGVPREADLVIDVRFLQNPHYVDELRKQCGRDKPVADYINLDPDFPQFITNLKTLIAPLLPRYASEGKSYLTLAIGCTGGKHRSVYVTELMYKWLEESGFPVRIFHRDLKVVS
jgi:UPF0042 nucleotide-binding protein